MKTRIGILLLTLFIGSTVMAADLPPGKWWRRPDVVRMLSLTDDQQSRLEATFRGAAADLIDLKAEVDKQSVTLRGELDQPVLNRQNVQKAGSRLNEARSRLFARELMLLVDMRAVLSDEQWKRMRAELDRMGAGKQQLRPDEGFRKRQ